MSTQEHPDRPERRWMTPDEWFRRRGHDAEHQQWQRPDGCTPARGEGRQQPRTGGR